jgi:glycosyltransferase involved in cell wall biosynthesis
MVPDHTIFPVTPASIRERLHKAGCCVIIPTFNNDRTLAQVIHDVSEFSADIIIVNDGSTDRTRIILNSFQEFTVVEIPRNRGKGNALQEGFRKAISMGFSYAITIDSDGQHFPDDIPLFLEILETHPGSLIIGARDMEQGDVPSASSFGHRFSIFWFHVETGLSIPDVQTGFRLYPLDRIRGKRFYTRKYEFEVEVLVRMAWWGVPIHSVPVRVYYAPKEERVSHFRKFRDFFRTSILNAVLVFMALLWFRPFMFLGKLRNKSFRGFLRESIMESKDSNLKLSLSVGLGAFFSIFPVWGWQMVTALSVAYLLRLNKLVTLAFSNLSIPPVIPFILYVSYRTGGMIVGTEPHHMAFDPGHTLDRIKHNVWQYLVGSIIVSVVVGGTFALLSYILLFIFRRKGRLPAGNNTTG